MGKVTQLSKGAASQATRTQSHSFFSSSGRSIKLQLSLNFLSIFLLIPLYNSEITKSILKPIICLAKKKCLQLLQEILRRSHELVYAQLQPKANPITTDSRKSRLLQPLQELPVQEQYYTVVPLLPKVHLTRTKFVKI